MKRATRYVIWTASAAFAAYSAVASLARYATFHNHTFDLAYYARQAWGLGRGDFWEPVVGAHFLGTHVALVLWPLGLLGKLLGTVPVLIFAQALCFGLATLPLAAFGARRFGDVGALGAACAWLLYPNLGHVATYEFHPGSLGVLPLALALDALDRKDSPVLVGACVALLLCRADLSLLVLALAALALASSPRLRRAGFVALGLSLGYLLLQFAVLRHYWPAHGSLSLHFGPWGGSPLGIVRALFTEPTRVVQHFAEPARFLYVPKVLLPLGLLPLLSPRWLLPTLPFLAINLISVFPTTTGMYSHYLTLAVPSLVVGALDGIHHVARDAAERPYVGKLGLLALCGAVAFGSVTQGGMPWSMGFVRADFRRDEAGEEAARTLAVIGKHVSVQAPDRLLPHLAERRRLHRAPPPDRATDFVVLDVSHRVRFARDGTLLRTQEEPLTRTWLARPDYGLVHAESTLLTFVRGADTRKTLGARYLLGDRGEDRGIKLTKCLVLTSAWLAPEGVELELFARGPCPNDLAIRLGGESPPERVDLLFDGLLSPALLRQEYVRSFHALDATERAAVLNNGLHLGALRSSGATPEPTDPISVRAPLVR